jgi:DNA-binding response OmpR family regulator
MTRTILLIEDDPGTRDILQLMLQQDGYRVRSVSSAEEGLTEASANEPDAILLDLHLPVMDGLQYLRRLRASRACSGPPVAILTADYFLDEDLACELRALGARIHFKPVWDTDLRRIVEDLIAERAHQ